MPRRQLVGCATRFTVTVYCQAERRMCTSRVSTWSGAAFGEDVQGFVRVRRDHAHRHIYPAVVAEDLDGCAIHEQFQPDHALDRRQRGCLVQARQPLLLHIVRHLHAADYETHLLRLAEPERRTDVKQLALDARHGVLAHRQAQVLPLLARPHTAARSPAPAGRTSARPPPSSAASAPPGTASSG